MKSVALLRSALLAAERASARAAAARSRLPPGSSRARVTSANAKWSRAAEHRDRLARELAEMTEMVDREMSELDAKVGAK